MKYRADIDGLRAVAVLMVVFYHAGFNFVPGGFVGVDVFFVISGYLITEIVFREVQNDTFTLAGFYARRIKRILPAFYVVGLATLFAGYFLLLPSTYTSLSESLLSGSLFVANIFFWREAGGYFGENVQESPLLHTWSLSVEEQFYFFWPLMIVLLYRKTRPQTLVPLSLLAIIVMFGAAEWGAKYAPGPTYYLLPTRAGELMMGAILAFMPSLGTQWNKQLINLTSALGLVLLAASALLLSKNSTFPGINSLWPCLGAMLVILSGRNKESLSAKLLSARPAVFIGLISYSLYLWHWPLVVFTNYLQYDITPRIGILIVLASITLAFTSWKYVEQPFRKLKAPFLTLFVKFFVLPCIITTSLCLYIISTNSNFNYSPLQSPYLETKSHEARKLCHVNNAQLPDIGECRIGTVGANNKSILWGDSHANSLAGFLNSVGSRTGEEIIDITFGDCPPLLDVKIDTPKLTRECAQRNINVANLIRNDRSINNVYIVGAYDGYLAASYAYPIDKIKQGLLNSINLVISNGKQAILPIDVPRFKRSMYLAGLKNNMPFANKISYATDNKLTNEMRSVLNMYSDIAALTPNVRFVDVRSLLCRQGHCSPYVDGLPMYEDGNHLNWMGSEYLGILYLKQNDGKFRLYSWHEISNKYSLILTAGINATH